MGATQTLAAVATYIVLVITLFGMISMVFKLSGLNFLWQFFILLVLFFLAVAAMMGLGNGFPWAWKLLLVFFAITLADMLLLYTMLPQKPALFTEHLVAVVSGFFIALFSMAGKKPAKMEKTFKPGKFVASKFGGTYHIPRCDWAKKIKKNNVVWFNTKEDAKRAGHKPHSCVK